LSEKVSKKNGELNFEILMEASPDAVLIHRDMKILKANPAAADLLGFKNPTQMIGRSVLDFVHPDNRGMVEKRRQKLLNNGNLEIVEQKNVTEDGRII
jgi:PAS domain S-box-containing protein